MRGSGWPAGMGGVLRRAQVSGVGFPANVPISSP